MYALVRRLAPGAAAQPADELELSRTLGLALLAPLPAVPDFTSQLSSGTDVQVRAKHSSLQQSLNMLLLQCAQQTALH